jgi:hypothetical protein
MAKPVFSAHVVWHNRHHSPVWEIETEHPGFTSAVAAALFANGVFHPGPRCLDVTTGRLSLLLTTEETLELFGDGRVRVATEPPAGGLPRGEDPRTRPGLAGIVVRLWQLPTTANTSGVVIASDADYIEVPVAVNAIAEAGLEGRWRPASYEVRGPAGHVTVTIELDPVGEQIIAHVEDEVVSDENAGHETATIALIAKA